MGFKKIAINSNHWMAIATVILFISQAQAQFQSNNVCRSVYTVGNSIGYKSNNPRNKDLNVPLTESEKLYQSIRYSYNQGFHSTIFLRPFMKHNIGKMIDKVRQKSDKLIVENSSQEMNSVNIEAIKRFKNIKMHISETQDEVARSTLAMMSWIKPWLQYAEYSPTEKKQMIEARVDSYLGLQTLLLLNIRSERLAGTYSQFENYDAFLVRDIQVIEARRMVLRMDFVNDFSLDISLREQAEKMDRKLGQLINQIKVLRVVVSAAQSVMRQELAVAKQFRGLYFSNTPVANSDLYLQAKDLINMYLQEASSFENKISILPLVEQKILNKLLRTLNHVE